MKKRIKAKRIKQIERFNNGNSKYLPKGCLTIKQVLESLKEMEGK